MPDPYPNQPNRVEPLFARAILDLPETTITLNLNFGYPEAPPEWAEQSAIGRMSQAANCNRQLGYKLEHVNKTDPPTPADQFNMNLGTIIHELWQTRVVDVLPEWKPRPEVPATIDFPDGPLLGRSHLARGFLDLVAWRPSDNTPGYVEGKTMAAYSYELQTGASWKGDPEGPSLKHITQVALGVHATHVDGVDEPLQWGRLAVFSKQVVSKGKARDNELSDDDRIVAEWEWSADELRPFYDAEIERLAGVASVVEGGEFPTRRVPDKNPLSHCSDDSDDRASEILTIGAATHKGNYEVLTLREGHDGEITPTKSGQYDVFDCSYCDYRQLCDHLGPGRVAVTEVPVAMEAVASGATSAFRRMPSGKVRVGRLPGKKRRTTTGEAA